MFPYVPSEGASYLIRNVWQTKSESGTVVFVDEPRKSAIIAVCASILAARKLAATPRNSPAYIAAIADAVADAKRIVNQIERENSRGR